MPARPGRPRSADSRRNTLSIKLSDAELAAIEDARGTVKLTEWARQALLAAVPPPRPESPRRARKPAPESTRRCTHPGTRVIGGYCPACDHLTDPGGFWRD